MPDTYQPKALPVRTRPRTLAEMFEDIAILADQNHLERVLMAIDHARVATELEIDRQRPGWAIDRLLGTSSKENVHD